MTRRAETARPGRAKAGDDFDVRLLDGRLERWSYDVRDEEGGLRLDQFLAGRLTWRSRTSVGELIDAGLVELEPARSARRNRRVLGGERVHVLLPRPVRDEARLQAAQAEGLQLPRLFEDERLIAIDKPPDIPVHPAGRLLHHTVITQLHREYRAFDDPLRDIVPKLCHRLDLETSGVLLVAKDKEALAFVQRQFERRTVKKEYLVLVHGEVAGEEGLIELPIGPHVDARRKHMRSVRFDLAQPARTRWKVVRRHGAFTQLHIELLTGRHHQIRVHCAAVGHPVVGDKIYGADPELFFRYSAGTLTDADHARLLLPRQALHSHALTFKHPDKGEMRLVSPWPTDLAAFCAGLRAP